MERAAAGFVPSGVYSVCGVIVGAAMFEGERRDCIDRAPPVTLVRT